MRRLIAAAFTAAALTATPAAAAITFVGVVDGDYLTLSLGDYVIDTLGGEAFTIAGEAVTVGEDTILRVRRTGEGRSFWTGIDLDGAGGGGAVRVTALGGAGPAPLWHYDLAVDGAPGFQTFSPGVAAGWSALHIAGLADFGFRADNILVTPLPEPGTWALMLGGFGLAGAALRRRQAAVAV